MKVLTKLTEQPDLLNDVNHIELREIGLCLFVVCYIIFSKKILLFNFKTLNIPQPFAQKITNEVVSTLKEQEKPDSLKAAETACRRLQLLLRHSNASKDTPTPLLEKLLNQERRSLLCIIFISIIACMFVFYVK